MSKGKECTDQRRNVSSIGGGLKEHGEKRRKSRQGKKKEVLECGK